MLTERRVIAAKVETTEGTAMTLAAADGGILAIKPKMTPNIKMFPRKVVAATLSQLPDVPGGQSAKFTFSAEVKGPGASYSASVLPALDKYIRACGFAATLTAGTSVVYAPASTGVPSITIGCYEDGVIKTLVGARGNLKISMKANEPIIMEFEFEGQWGGVVDGALLAPTYETTFPPALLGAVLTVGAYTPIISKLDIDMKNKIQLRENPAIAAGYLSAIIADRDAGGKFDPEMTTVAGYDWYGKWKAGTSAALTVGPVGAVQYNKCTITAPVLVPRKAGDGDRSGLATVDYEFQLAMSSGDDEISISFT